MTTGGTKKPRQKITYTLMGEFTETSLTDALEYLREINEKAREGGAVVSLIAVLPGGEVDLTDHD